MENFNVLVGNMLKELRESKGIPQKEVSIILKKDHSMVSMWERGKRQMNIGDLIFYLDAIRATPKEKDDLFRYMAKIKKENYDFDYKNIK
jgi:transcriptional regulator with XRE-family HTH domain